MKTNVEATKDPQAILNVTQDVGERNAYSVRLSTFRTIPQKIDYEG